MTDSDLADRSINAIRFLAADAVEKANSGHPGLPMGVAPLAYVLWTRHMNFDPQDPKWPNRDRFVLSAGHGSMLLYSMLHLTGYDLPMEEIKRFRQWGSMTPGHPEYGEAPGVETTTGPLGQGFANAVGMALAAEHMAAIYNRDDLPVVDHQIYAIVSDGDLMEGIASEAASLAGHLKLGRLVYLYDDNRISIDGSTDLSFTENRAARFEAYGWHLSFVEDVLKLDEVDRAITAARSDPRPSLIVCRTHIGYGMPTKQDTSAAHGEPPGEEELNGAKENLGWPLEPRFLVPADVREHFASSAERGKEKRRAWVEMMDKYRSAHGELAETWDRVQAGSLPEGLEAQLPVFEPDAKGMATRASSGKALNDLAHGLPELIGGSADLTGSNKTDIKGEESFSQENRSGRYIHFGVREHAMGGMLNGMALYGGLIPYGGTFLIFSDYMRHAIRLAAMMHQRVIYVFTHDSIGLGEDGPTHQPIEQLPGLRAIPNLTVIRPGDANETAYAWLAALQRSTGPTALALSRQSVPTLDLAPAKGLLRGAYVLADLGEDPPRVILMASGSELGIIVEAGEKLVAEGIPVRLVSFPSWELFQEQSDEYRREVLPEEVRARVAIEAASPFGWERWVGDGGAVIGLDRFGASAPYEEIYQNLGLTSERIVEQAKELIARLADTQMRSEQA
ncbi:MAG: transketolase [Anaerolineae bacterium]|nr:MAG: transketolase [Anaerolineae bacterium]